VTATLSGSDLVLFRGERCLFKGLSFALNPGELLLLEGQNGCGKTSLMRAIAGLLEFDSGQILWDGQPVKEFRQDFHGAMVWMAHRTGLKADLTLVENLQFESSLRTPSGAVFEDVLERLGIQRLKKLPVRSLSAGQQRRVSLARMLLSDARLWLMDEPVTNLDRDGRRLVMDLVNEHLATDGMCLMAAHQDIEIQGTVQKVQL
jgi:heme exporter protein A